MPTYQYECENCGPFVENRPMAEFSQPQPCPDCAEPAPRMLTSPMIGGGAQQDSLGNAPAPRAHAGGCACCAAPPRRLAAEAV